MNESLIKTVAFFNSQIMLTQIQISRTGRRRCTRFLRSLEVVAALMETDDLTLNTWPALWQLHQATVQSHSVVFETASVWIQLGRSSKVRYDIPLQTSSLWSETAGCRTWKQTDRKLHVRGMECESGQLKLYTMKKFGRKVYDLQFGKETLFLDSDLK